MCREQLRLLGRSESGIYKYRGLDNTVQLNERKRAIGDGLVFISPWLVVMEIGVRTGTRLERKQLILGGVAIP